MDAVLNVVVNKRRKEQIQQRSNEIHNNEYEIIGDYINTETKIEILHKVCHSRFLQRPSSHLNRNRCPICYGKNRLTKEILQERSNMKYNEEYEILGEYINSSTPILIQHKVCGYEYKQIPNNHLRRKCFRCYGTPKRTKEQFQELSNRLHNKEYILIGEYNGANEKVKLRHKLCGKEFSIIAYSHLNADGRCTYCYHSKGENKIYDYLSLNKIEFNENKSFDGCKYIYKLRFDFYLPNYNTCIEYDGIQHHEAIEWFGGDEALKKSRERDDAKNNWCLLNNIHLIRISYLDDIEYKLDKYFNI